MYYPKIPPVGISHKQGNTPRIFITLSFITVVTWKHWISVRRNVDKCPMVFFNSEMINSNEYEWTQTSYTYEYGLSNPESNVNKVLEGWQLHNIIYIFYRYMYIVWYKKYFGIIKFKFGKVDICIRGWARVNRALHIYL